MYLSSSGRPKEGLRVADAEIAVNANYPSGYVNRGIAELHLDQFEQAKSDLQQALRLSPRDPRKGWFHDVMADAELGLGRFGEAIEEDNKAIDAGFKIFGPYLGMAVAHALKGEIVEGKTALTEARRLNPKLSVNWLKERDYFVMYMDPLRKLGLPEE